MEVSYKEYTIKEIKNMEGNHKNRPKPSYKFNLWENEAPLLPGNEEGKKEEAMQSNR